MPLFSNEKVDYNRILFSCIIKDMQNGYEVSRLSSSESDLEVNVYLATSLWSSWELGQEDELLSHQSQCRSAAGVQVWALSPFSLKLFQKHDA